MHTVTLFISDDRDRELLAEWLSKEYDVSTPREPRVSVGTDLVVVDDASFPELKAGLQSWKDEQDPVFAPVLLVTEQTQDESFDPSDWQTIDGLYVIDDIVSMPLKKAVLYRRMENLLERRDLSGQLEQRFRRSEQRFARLFDGIPDPVVVLDDEKTITSANDAFRSLIDLDPETELPPTLAGLETIPSTAVTEIEAAAQTVFDGERVDEQRTIRLDTNGEPYYAELSAALLQTDGGREAVVVLRDVTDRRRRERELETTEERFRQIGEHVSEIIWLTTLDGDLLYVSPGYEQLTGRDSENLGTGPVDMALEYAHPADRERLQSYTDQIFSDPTSQETHTIEYRLFDTDGETRWVRIDTYPVTGPDGDVDRLVGMLEDITERKQRERRFNAIFNRTFQLTGLLEPDGTVLEVNDRAVEYLDLDRGQIIGTPVSRAAEGVLSGNGSKRLQERIEEAAEGSFVRYEESVATADGTAATLDISIKPITDSFGDVALLVVEARDVTDRKRRERELARQNERLEEFASIVSHDLRNPLQIVRARIGLTADTGDLDHLEDAERAVDRMDRLIDDLLDLARHGDLSVDPELISLDEVATHAWISVDAPSATMTVDSSAPIQADTDRLIQLLENLFRNAAEHGGDGVTVHVGTTDDGFYIEDDGPGIDDDSSHSVFDLGHTSDSGGTGFGLAIVKEIVDAHGWTIDVTTAESGGARFEVSGVERM